MKIVVVLVPNTLKIVGGAFSRTALNVSLRNRIAAI